MPSRLKRWHTFGHDHFVTFSCYHRHPYLNDDHSRTVFLQTLEHIRQKHSFQVYGYVLMPEHVHLLLNEPKQTILVDVFRQSRSTALRLVTASRKLISGTPLMAANPIPVLTTDQRALTRDEWWDLVFSLQGSAKEMLAEVGGGEAWVRYLREGEPEDFEG